jgi:rod shape-determining protein MreB
VFTPLLFSRDIGIDLGTANTLVWVRGRGIVIAEPSVVAKDLRTGAPLAIGAEAKRMVGRTPASIVAVRPLKDGVNSDFDMTELMLKHYIDKVHDRALLFPRPASLGSSALTEVEKRAVQDAALSAGARWARLVEEPMAAAIGAGLPVNEPSGSMIVDIGGGTTEVAVTSLGGIVVSRSIRIGGDEMDADIVAYARREFNLLMGERTAEDIKIAIGSAYPLDEEVSTFFFGRDLLPTARSIEVTSAQIREYQPSAERSTRLRLPRRYRRSSSRMSDRHLPRRQLAGSYTRVSRPRRWPCTADDPLTATSAAAARSEARARRTTVVETWTGCRGRREGGELRPRGAQGSFLRPFAVLFLGSALLLLARNSDPVRAVATFGTELLVPVQRVLAEAGITSNRFVQAITEIERLRQDNATLRADVDRLTLENVQLREAAFGAQQSAKLNDVALTLPFATVQATVIARDPSNILAARPRRWDRSRREGARGRVRPGARGTGVRGRLQLRQGAADHRPVVDALGAGRGIARHRHRARAERGLADDGLDPPDRGREARRRRRQRGSASPASCGRCAPGASSSGGAQVRPPSGGVSARSSGRGPPPLENVLVVQAP